MVHTCDRAHFRCFGTFWFNFAMYARKAETMKRKRELQKERRQKKCDINEEHLKMIDDELIKVANGDPQHPFKFFAAIHWV